MPGLFAELYRSSLCHMVQKLQAFMSVANLGTHTLDLRRKSISKLNFRLFAVELCPISNPDLLYTQLCKETLDLFIILFKNLADIR